MSKKEKYKLIQWYPSLPNGVKEGDTVWQPRNKECEEFWGYTTKTLALSGTDIPVEEVESNPEFWKKVEEKNYEVLLIKGVCSGEIKKFKSTPYSFPLASHEIHSVERLSDGEVFTVGNRVEHTEGATFSIYSIVRKKGGLKFTSGTGITASIDEIERKEFLFVTDDGVEIYSGDKFYGVDYYPAGSFPIYTIVTETASTPLNYHKTFKSKAEAGEYVEEHRPQYSKADIKEVLEKSSLGHFHRTVKKEILNTLEK